MVIGTPCSGPSWSPRASASSAARAEFRARSVSQHTTALIGSSSSSMRVIKCSSASADDTSRPRIAAARSAADHQCRSVMFTPWSWEATLVAPEGATLRRPSDGCRPRRRGRRGVRPPHLRMPCRSPRSSRRARRRSARTRRRRRPASRPARANRTPIGAAATELIAGRSTTIAVVVAPALTSPGNPRPHPHVSGTQHSTVTGVTSSPSTVEQ